MKRGLILSGMLAALVACGDQLDNVVGPVDEHTVSISRGDPQANGVLHGVVSGFDSSTSGGPTPLQGITVEVYQLVPAGSAVSRFDTLPTDTLPTEPPTDTLPTDSLPNEPPTDTLPTDSLPNDPPTWQLRGTVTTGVNGQFTVLHIPAGQYKVYAKPGVDSPWAPSGGWGLYSVGTGATDADILLFKKTVSGTR